VVELGNYKGLVSLLHLRASYKTAACQSLRTLDPLGRNIMPLAS
jgi:hypothetical protein